MMKKAPKKIKYLLIATVIAVQIVAAGFAGIPVTGATTSTSDVRGDPAQSNPESKDFIEFVNSVTDGEAGVVRGLYSEDVLGYPVIQQPSGQPNFVSATDGVVTEFGMASEYGTTGILAHNYLAGSSFFSLQINDVVQLIYGDGSVKEYKIAEVLSYQALSPDSASSSFVDLNTGETLTSTQLFKRVYTGSHHLTLQTCIEKGSEDSWGRLFIIAEPVS